MDIWYPFQVKQKDKVGRPDIDSFEAVMMRNDRTKGFFVGFDFSSDAEREIGAFFKKTGKLESKSAGTSEGLRGALHHPRRVAAETGRSESRGFP